MEEMNKYLNSLRSSIQDIDESLYELIEKRNHHSIAVGNIKKELKNHIFSPQREHELYSIYLQKYPQALSIFQEIFAISKKMQGFVCYTLEKNSMTAKFCLGLSTTIIPTVRTDIPVEENLNAILFIQSTDAQLYKNTSLYCYAHYAIIHNTIETLYYAMASIPLAQQKNASIPLFTIYI